MKLQMKINFILLTEKKLINTKHTIQVVYLLFSLKNLLKTKMKYVVVYGMTI